MIFGGNFPLGILDLFELSQIPKLDRKTHLDQNEVFKVLIKILASSWMCVVLEILHHLLARKPRNTSRKPRNTNRNL